MSLSGKTRVAGVVGQPIAHSMSPVLHNAWIAAAGLVMVFGAVAALRAANHGGAGFTTGTARPARVVAIGLVATLLLFAAGVALGPTIRARVGQASKDIRAAIQFVTELAEQASFHPLAG